MIQTSNRASSSLGLQEIVGEVMEEFRKIISDEQPQALVMSTGFERLDDYLDGLKPGLHMLAGRAQMGKTTLMLTITDHICFEQKVPSLIFSMEQSAPDLLRRIIFPKACLDPFYHERKPVLVSKKELIRLKETADKIAASRLFIEENGSFWIDDLVNTAKRHKQENHIGFIAIDHLQLLRSNTTITPRVAEFVDIVSKLKRLSLELNVPILLVSGLMRKPPQSKKIFFGLPLAHHIKFYQSINGYMNSVMTLYRPRYYAESEEEREAVYRQAKLTICKSRNIEFAQISLDFDEINMRISSSTNEQ